MTLEEQVADLQQQVADLQRRLEISEGRRLMAENACDFLEEVGLDLQDRLEISEGRRLMTETAGARMSARAELERALALGGTWAQVGERVGQSAETVRKQAQRLRLEKGVIAQ